MSPTVHWLRRQAAGVVALTLVGAMFFVVRLPSASAATRQDLAARYAFTPRNVALPGGFAQQSVRKVNKDYQHIDAWISSVGAGIAMNDLDGDGLSNDLCVTDPRIDQVVVTPAPGAGEERYAPFALRPDGLPMTPTMAPMGCAPGDFNEDGRMDLLVYLWGRTPILYMARGGASALSAVAFHATELVSAGPGATYTGPLWNTNAVAIDDFDGDGHTDIYIGNYFPDGPVLDPSVRGGVEMNDSMSHGLNGGTDHIFRWTGGSGGDRPAATFDRLDDAIPDEASRGWALGSSTTDLDGDLLPELYLAHDFGPDRLLHNRSTPGHVEFAVVEGVRNGTVPKSKRVGGDSFKGMGVDFGDLDGDGMYDMFVSNITTSFGIVESNFAFMNTAGDQADVKRRLGRGDAPFEDRSASMGLAWSGWGWDVKMADFANSGDLAVAQSLGFVKGEVNRWAQLQELATANDGLLRDPMWWPTVGEGDDVGGGQTLHFFVKGPEGRYVNIAPELGLDIPVPTRGIATGDADGDGRLDWAVARQWGDPVFYHNDSPEAGNFLGLRLTRASAEARPEAAGVTGGGPAVGAQVTVRTADGRTLLGRVDGGGGHSGKRSNEVHIGLGDTAGPLQVQLRWRDAAGRPRERQLRLNPGWHELQLGSEVTRR